MIMESPKCPGNSLQRQLSSFSSATGRSPMPADVHPCWHQCRVYTFHIWLGMLQEGLMFELIFKQLYVLLRLVKIRTLYLNVLTVPEWQKCIYRVLILCTWINVRLFHRGKIKFSLSIIQGFKYSLYILLMRLHWTLYRGLVFLPKGHWIPLKQREMSKCVCCSSFSDSVQLLLWTKRLQLVPCCPSWV